MPPAYSGPQQAYNAGYKAGFAQGFEDGHQLAYEQQV
jgi:flagellar biosynthesis/type III secretory pathway protein FliH